MRVIVFFDLPMRTAAERKRYTRFRKHILDKGFIMLQQSVYSKIAVSEKVVPGIIKDLEQNKPEGGSVAALTITEQEYARIEYICGERFGGEYIDSIESVVFV